jgi:hypothetical protein
VGSFQKAEHIWQIILCSFGKYFNQGLSGVQTGLNFLLVDADAWLLFCP